MELGVQYNVLENGEKQLIVRGNMGAATSVLSADLAASLAANTDFTNLFEAKATSPATGAVAFTTVNWNNPHGITEGGYKIESAYDLTSKPMATSSGISMFGQADNNERLVIESENLGSHEFVNVNVVKGYLNTVDDWGFNTGYRYGSDMVATINGNRATAQGNNLSINTSGLAMTVTAANYPGFSGFTITGGGALFQLGPDVVSQQQVRIGIASMLTSAIGGNNGRLYQLKSGESASVEGSDGSRKLADRIVNDAISYVANARGRLGAFQRGTLEPNIAALQDSMVALAEAEAMYTNADFAVESSNLTRLQLLIQAGMQTLGIANQIPQYAAALIR
jgi:flagellin-like hook-associated protein FlgL